jgi:predicted RNase H-like nuclease (RuvC/YqgF family)
MGPNEDREQRLHDAKMERLAREEAEKDQLVKDGNRLADALVKSREEVLKLREQIESLGAEKDAMVLQNQELQKNYDAMHKLWEIADREWRNADRLDQEYRKLLKRCFDAISQDGWPDLSRQVLDVLSNTEKPKQEYPQQDPLAVIQPTLKRNGEA